jgi:tRNA (guanine-N7-)-methyltransferase
VFARVAPIEVDLGCGEGSFLAAAAAENPARNFLGVERQRARVRSTGRKIQNRGLTNARVLHAEISEAVSGMFPPSSVATFHIMFPDPWPKRRHAPRRLITSKFLSAIERTLEPGGQLRIVTDHSDYFAAIRRCISALPQFAIVGPNQPAAAPSKFERMFVLKGVPIHRLWLRKTSPVT